MRYGLRVVRRVFLNIVSDGIYMYQWLVCPQI